MRISINIALVVLLGAAPCQLQAQSSFHLEAQVKNSPTPYAIIYSDNGNDTIPIHEDGSLSWDKQLVKSSYATFMIPKVRMFLGIWMQNGKEALVSLDAENPDDVILTGSVQKESEFMKEELASISKWRPNAGSFTEYEKAWQSLADSILTTAKTLENQELNRYQEAYLQQQRQDKLSTYFQILQQKGHKADADSYYNSFMKSLNIGDITNSSGGVLFNYLQWKAQCKNPSANMNYYAMMQVLSEEVSNQTVRDELAFRLFRLLMTSNDKSHAEEAFRLAVSMTSQDVQQKIQNFYLGSSRPEGSEIPDFNILDINEKPVSFKSICNRPVVYVDVWSTWCVPCCKEIPFVAKLVEKYKDNPNIKFVSLSIDKNRSNWKKFLAKQEDKWEQFLVAEDLQRHFFNIFAINGIPRFMVFDGRGRIININEVRPSADNIEEILNGYLQRYK